jgi:hypothetical protein
VGGRMDLECWIEGETGSAWSHGFESSRGKGFESETRSPSRHALPIRRLVPASDNNTNKKQRCAPCLFSKHQEAVFLGAFGSLAESGSNLPYLASNIHCPCATRHANEGFRVQHSHVQM